MMIATIDELPGPRVIRALGLVKGRAIRARHLRQEFMAGLKRIVGAEIEAYTRLLAYGTAVTVQQGAAA